SQWGALNTNADINRLAALLSHPLDDPVRRVGLQIELRARDPADTGATGLRAVRLPPPAPAFGLRWSAALLGGDVGLAGRDRRTQELDVPPDWIALPLESALGRGGLAQRYPTTIPKLVSLVRSHGLAVDCEVEEQIEAEGKIGDD